MKDFFLHVWNKMEERTAELEQHLTTFGIFLIIAFPLFYFINIFLSDHRGYESIFLRVSIGILGALIALRKKWPQRFLCLKPALLYFTLLYSFPFFFFFMLFQNPDSNIWQVNTVVGLVVLYMLLSWADYLILSVVGGCLAGLIFWLVSTNPSLPNGFFDLLLAYISPFIYLILFSTKKEHIQKAKQQSLQMQAGAIAHEMRTPLAALSGVGLFLKKIIPSLVKDHNKLTPDLQEEHFSEKRLSQIMKSPEMIIKVTRQAFSFIDVMLMNLREEFKDEHREQCSIKACVEDALKQYPFSGEDRSMVHTQIEADFLFMGNPLLIKHIFFNLLKNCLYYVKAANKGDITIKTAKVDERHILSFKDTGAGIAPDILPYIFDKFYSRTKYGTGIGLAFCKSVMKSLGGDIICKSQLGEYTEFILTFPTLEKA
jgi:signal transduction histidine kinase